MQSIHPGRSGPLATASTGVHAWLSILCGAGCGLVLWLAVSSTLLPAASVPVRRLLELQAWGLGLGIVVLAMTGLGCCCPARQPQAPGGTAAWPHWPWLWSVACSCWRCSGDRNRTRPGVYCWRP